MQVCQSSRSFFKARHSQTRYRRVKTTQVTVIVEGRGISASRNMRRNWNEPCHTSQKVKHLRMKANLGLTTCKCPKFWNLKARAAEKLRRRKPATGRKRLWKRSWTRQRAGIYSNIAVTFFSASGTPRSRRFCLERENTATERHCVRIAVGCGASELENACTWGGRG